MFRATDRGRVASHRHASRGRPAEVLRNRPACANQPGGLAPWLYPVTEARQFCGRRGLTNSPADWHKLHITAVQSSGTVCNLSDIERTRFAEGRAHAAWICRVLEDVRAKEGDLDAMQRPPLPGAPKKWGLDNASNGPGKEPSSKSAKVGAVASGGMRVSELPPC